MCVGPPSGASLISCALSQDGKAVTGSVKIGNNGAGDTSLGEAGVGGPPQSKGCGCFSKPRAGMRELPRSLRARPAPAVSRIHGGASTPCPHPRTLPLAPVLDGIGPLPAYPFLTYTITVDDADGNQIYSNAELFTVGFTTSFLVRRRRRPGARPRPCSVLTDRL